jgi:DNA invertase Pin-like site-specific DNA recombinase
MKKVRCAIYTRKSSEEGLEQDFNSLHAQREACAAYILSQASEGWSLLPEEYDDGGLSGGSLQRPAVQRLLADIEAGKIDIVVVYKVDRLTRSLLDFAKLVETFDKAEVSFVSVTQSFNTTNSMGRLTLNMLLSFAQFEREVTAERIRDKIAASKAKGMWMGGNPPLGYKPDGRTLALIDEDAELIRELFRRYGAIGNVRLLKEQLDADGIVVPERWTSTGRKMGGVPFTRGQIYKILSNPIYVGEIHHKGNIYAGQHQAIIEKALWDEVQGRLSENLKGHERSRRARKPTLLSGRVVDESGDALVASHATKGKVRYRYYVSKALQHEPGTTGIRIPALELEKTLAEGLARAIENPLSLAEVAALSLSAEQTSRLANEAPKLAERVRKRERAVIRQLVECVTVGQTSITAELRSEQLAAALQLALPASSPASIAINIAASLKRSGRAMRLLHCDGRAAGSSEPQEHLLKLLHRARSWWSEMNEHQLTAADIARRHNVSKSYASRVLRLSFLAPNIVEAIVSGMHPAALDAKTLLNLHDLPPAWSKQMRELHFQ